MATPEVLQRKHDLFIDDPQGENVKPRGMTIEKKIEVLENLTGNVSNRRTRRWLNDRLLMELVPRLNAEEIRGLFAPPPWGDDVPLSPFCMATGGDWDKFRNIDMDREVKVIETLESSSSKRKGHVDVDKMSVLAAWHRIDCRTREALRRSFLAELIDGYESFTRMREAIIGASNMIADKLGGGYLFGLPVGFVADSIGATIGATSAFLLGRTIGRSYVISKLNNYPKFQAVAVAVERSGFKIVLLLRLVPLLPFNMLNYLLSVTPVRLGEYMLASWLGMMPITFALVYVGTTLKDLSDVTHGWGEISTTRWIFIASGFVISVILLAYITKVAKASLDKALEEGAGIEGILASPGLPVVAEPPLELQNHLIIKIDSAGVDRV